MSAFLVDPQTIGILASYAAKHNLLEYAPCHGISAHDAQSAARTLANCNIRSVEHRYPDLDFAGEFMSMNNAEYVRECMKWAQAEYLHITLAQLAKHCDCLDYQSCETDDWYDSDGYKILTAIRKELTRNFDGYEAAQWA